MVRKDRVDAFRKHSTAHRAVSSIESEIEIFLTNCPFLASAEAEGYHQSSSCVARFDRSDVEVGELLGKGAFSEVYQVKALNLNSSCCQHEGEQDTVRCDGHQACKTNDFDADRFIIKHLRPELLTQRSKFNNAAADLILEAKFLAALEHPNIIKIRGWAANGAASYGDGNHDSFFVILEHLDEILSRRISEWRRDPSSAPPMDRRLGYATQVASALKYLHSKKIIYRDLKCDNIGIKNGNIRLFDLGLCRELPEDATQNQMFHMSGVGTLRYVAPEIVLGTGYNLLADVYSFSIVFHEILALSKPYDLYNIDLYRMLVCEEGERPLIDSSWPEEVQTLLSSMWDSDPSLRPSMRDVHMRLLDIQSKTTPDAFWKAPFHFSKRLVRMATGSFCEGTSTTVTSDASLK